MPGRRRALLPDRPRLEASFDASWVVICISSATGRLLAALIAGTAAAAERLAPFDPARYVAAGQ